MRLLLLPFVYRAKTKHVYYVVRRLLAAYIDDTNQEGRTRSGINTSVGPDPSAETEGLHEGLA